MMLAGNNHVNTTYTLAGRPPTVATTYRACGCGLTMASTMAADVTSVVAAASNDLLRA
jgi:hypothetical protein